MRKRIIAVAAIAILALAAVLVFTDRERGDQAVKPIPAQNHAPDMVPSFLQNDDRWAEDILGESRFNMGGSGCLVSCIAATLDAQGVDTDPGRLNSIFGEYKVYNEEGEVLWNRIADAVPHVRVDAPSRVDAARLERELACGRYPIVKVKYQGDGYQHWVLIVGAADGEYLCMDPLNGDGKPIPLSRHGGVIYRVRYVWVEGD